MIRFLPDQERPGFIAIDEDIPGLSGAGPTRFRALQALQKYIEEMSKEQRGERQWNTQRRA